MKTKILSGLKETYSNLGLPEDVLSNYAGMVAGFMAADADDEAIKKAVKDAEGYLKSVQGFSDKRVADAVKKAKTEGGNEPNQNNEPSAEMKQVLELLNAQKAANEAMAKRMDELENKRKADDRETLVSKIAAELGLKDEALVFAKAKLSVDAQDEKSIRDSLGESKQALIKLGLRVEGSPQVLVQEEEAARKEAADWVKAQAELNK